MGLLWSAAQMRLHAQGKKMNKTYFTLLCAAAFIHTGQATAAGKAGFTCEKIKDKATRESCIQDRVEKEMKSSAEKERIATAEKERIATAEKEKSLADEKKKAFEDFVRKSKEALTRNYKDPSSAQFTNLVVANALDSNRKFLCGSVNAKNSYGGYVGSKVFYVMWSGAGDPDPWTEGDWYTRGTALAEQEFKYVSPGLSGAYQTKANVDAIIAKHLALEKEAVETAKAACQASATNQVTKVES
jgi:hypothetical protein